MENQRYCGPDAVSYTHLDVYKRQLRISFEGGGSGADLTFSEWDAVAPFVAPPASQVIKG